MTGAYPAESPHVAPFISALGVCAAGSEAMQLGGGRVHAAVALSAAHASSGAKAARLPRARPKQAAVGEPSWLDVAVRDVDALPTAIQTLQEPADAPNAVARQRAKAALMAVARVAPGLTPTRIAPLADEGLVVWFAPAAPGELPAFIECANTGEIIFSVARNGRHELWEADPDKLGDEVREFAARMAAAARVGSSATHDSARATGRPELLAR